MMSVDDVSYSSYEETYIKNLRYCSQEAGKVSQKENMKPRKEYNGKIYHFHLHIDFAMYRVYCPLYIHGFTIEKELCY